MDQKWLQMLVILVFYQQIRPGTAVEEEPNEGSLVEFRCKPGKGTLIIWFRVLDQSGMEFLASFSPSGQLKTRGPSFGSFSGKKLSDDEYSLTLNSYKSSDSGIYSCGSLINGNSLQFGEVKRLHKRKQKEVTQPPPTCTTHHIQPAPSMAATDCCRETLVTGLSSLSMLCAPIILGPLAGGCGLLLLMLIFVTVYCNRMRTRRCPHHYKRKLRTGVPDKMMTNF